MVVSETEYRRMLDAGFDTWSALKEAGYEAHAKNVYQLRRYAIEHPPAEDTAEAATCACGCGIRIVQSERGRPRRYHGDHRKRHGRKATK